MISILSTKFCKVHHFANDANLINFNSSIKVINKQVKDLKTLSNWLNANLINFNSSIKVINKQVNKDLKTLSNWLNANKICFNVSKTEIVLFRSAKNNWTST